MISLKTLACRILFFLSIIFFGESQELTLAYKDIGKPPYMEQAPDNSGLYLELASRATERIGITLNVIRLPKARTYYTLKNGDADLYPSGIFNEIRSEYLFFIPNGLYRYERYYALTALDIPELNSVQELNDHGLEWLVEMGSTMIDQAEDFGVDYSSIIDIRIEKALLLIQRNRPVCYRVIKEDLEEYMLLNNITSMEDYGIKVHKNCFPTKSEELYMGFSRKSPYYQEQPNISFNQNKPFSAENFPVELFPDSVPARLEIALQEMIENGEVEQLKLKYNIPSPINVHTFEFPDS